MKLETRRPNTGTVPEPANTEDIARAHSPRNLTFSENVILTMKIFGIAGALGAAIWGIEMLVAGN